MKQKQQEEFQKIDEMDKDNLPFRQEEFMNKNESLFPYTYDEDMEYAGTYFSEVIFESKRMWSNK